MPRLVMVTDGDSGFSIPAPESAAPIRMDAVVAEAFTELREPLGRYLLTLGMNRPEAEEVVQETFLRLCRHQAAKGAQPNLRGWIFRVAHNLARDEYRRRRRRPAEPLEEVSRDPGASPEQQAIADERAVRLMAALNRLPERQRECLHLRAEGLRYREIAEVLGAGVSTVAEWVQQGLKTLVKECDDNQH